MTSANGQSLMVPGQYLEPGQMLVSDNESFVLVYQTDGNLVVYQLSQTEKVPVWASKTKGYSAGRVVLHENGELVILTAEGVEVWRSQRWRLPGPNITLRMQNDGNVVAYELRPEDEAIQAPEYAYWATNTWERFERYALLIGVEEYPNFAGKELLAGRNDVLAMWQVCRRLGYKPKNIRVCTSPKLDPAQILDAEVALALSLEENRHKPQAEVRQTVEKQLAETELHLSDAKYDSVLDAVTWLGRKISKPFLKDKGTMVPAMLAYSGHGAQDDGELALCPSDVNNASDGTGLTNALRFSDIETLLSGYDSAMNESRNALKYLTIILDCCFSGGASGGAQRDNHRVTSLSSATTRKPITPIKPILGQRIFCAAGPNEQGYQALLGGRWHGAFTWAFTQALEQWKVEKKSGIYSHSTMSHTELLFRARMLLEALSFRQHPMLLDNIGNTPVFWSDGERVEGERYSRDDLALPPKRPYTSADPDRERTGIQMDTGGKPAALYTFGQDGSVFAQVLVIGSGELVGNGIKLAPNTEYWSITKAPTAGRDISITCSTDPDLKAFPAAGSQQTSTAARWSGLSGTLTTGWRGSDDRVRFSWSNGLPVWWYVEGRTIPSALVSPGGLSSLTAFTNSSGGSKYYPTMNTFTKV